jgi:hypothetical protein
VFHNVRRAWSAACASIMHHPASTRMLVTPLSRLIDAGNTEVLVTEVPGLGLGPDLGLTLEVLVLV